MNSQTSKAALKSLDLTEFLVMSTRIQKPSVSGELVQVFRPVIPEGESAGIPMPDWDGLQESHALILEASATEVRRADQAHRINKVTMTERRRKRRKLVGNLKTRHRDLRSSFSGTYGKEALALVGLDAPPERRFVAVREQQLEILERLRDGELASQLPEPRSGQAPLDLAAIADSMEAEILELEEIMEAIKRMQKRVDAALVAKRETLRRHRRLYLNVARIQESYYRLAGLDELADRIRSPKLPRRKPAGDEGQGDGTSAEGAADTQEEQEESEETPDSPPATMP